MLRRVGAADGRRHLLRGGRARSPGRSCSRRSRTRCCARRCSWASTSTRSRGTSPTAPERCPVILGERRARARDPGHDGVLLPARRRAGRDRDAPDPVARSAWSASCASSACGSRSASRSPPRPPTASRSGRCGSRRSRSCTRGSPAGCSSSGCSSACSPASDQGAGPSARSRGADGPIRRRLGNSATGGGGE